MGKYIDLTGQKFGELTVVSRLPRDERRKDNHTLYECVCSCGNIVIRPSNTLNDKIKRSCPICANRKYGSDFVVRDSRLYHIWLSMRTRCQCKNDSNYKNYGARGIAVCREWGDFNVFREWAYANGYSEELTRKECTLDRINVDGGYSPENCRWTNSGVQALNKRRIQNKSGARGVWVTKKGKYHAVISVNNKRHCLGTYEKLEDAVSARHEAEMKYFGISLEGCP